MKVAVWSLSIVLLAPASAAADAVTTWNANAAKAALAACIAPGDDPLHESRMYAMVHIAIHDALNAIERRSRPYIFDTRAPEWASRDAAVAAAARDVMVPVIGAIPYPAPCLDAGIASVEADYAAALAAIADGRQRRPASTSGARPRPRSSMRGLVTVLTPRWWIVAAAALTRARPRGRYLSQRTRSSFSSVRNSDAGNPAALTRLAAGS